MVIGNGLLASKFKKFNSDDYIFLTSGVSDSSVNDSNLFNREILLIEEMLNKHKDFIFVYFSTISVFNTESPYTNHKIYIEEMIKKSNSKYYIFRIPQIVGNGGNLNNFFNFIKNRLINELTIDVKNVKRSLIDIDDLYLIVEFILKNYTHSTTHNLSGLEFCDVIDIVKYISDDLNIKDTHLKKIEIVEKCYNINSESVDSAIRELNLQIDGYTKKLVKKYVKNI